jgi:hypothetical protein
MTKKTLVAKLSFDITGSDTLTEMMKAVLRQSFIEGGFTEDRIAFEVLVENEEDLVTSMLKAVQSGAPASEEEIAESEKSDGIGDFLSLFNSLFEDGEDEDEAEDDDE